MSALLLLPALAQAQLDPIVATLTIDRRGEHGCSQSFASSRERAEIALRIGPRGDAELHIDRRSDHTTGPSRGRFTAGDRGVYSITEREVHRLSGRASRDGEVLTIVFSRDETSSVRYQGPGTLPLPPTRSMPAALRMECRAAVHAVHADAPSGPSSAPQDDAGEPLRGLACVFTSGTPPTLPDDEPLPFAPGFSLALSVSDGVLLDRSRSRVLRRGASPPRGP